MINIVNSCYKKVIQAPDSKDAPPPPKKKKNKKKKNKKKKTKKKTKKKNKKNISIKTGCRLFTPVHAGLMSLKVSTTVFCLPVTKPKTDPFLTHNNVTCHFQ